MAHRIIIVGGGISGLAAAHRVVELSRERDLGLEVRLLEAGRRLGGNIATERIGGYLIEAGPDSFISEKPWAVRLCNRLGIGSRMVSANSLNQTVYVVRQGSLHPLPEGFFLLAPTRFWPLIRTPLFSLKGKLRMGGELFLPRGRVNADESVASFVRRRFGSEALERVAQPLIGGIYGADPEQLSLAATMPRFLEMERRQRSVIRALWSERRRQSRKPQGGSGARWSLFVTLADGMQELVDAIASNLPEGTARLETKVSGLEWNREKKLWRVMTGAAEPIPANGVILAGAAYSSAAILSSFAPELARELQAIPYSSAATVSLAYPQAQIPAGLDGFGVVVPVVESRKIIACTFSSLKYPGRAPAGHVLLRAFVGGALQPDLLAQDDRAMENSVRRELAELLGMRTEPLFCRIHRHVRAMPQYLVGHCEHVERIEARLAEYPDLALAGNGYRGVGIADCVRSGEEAAERLVGRASGSPASSDAAHRAFE